MAELSILNPHPVLLPGANLLHDLIPYDPDDSVVAVDYLARDDNLQSLTYAELHGAANALARRLLAYSNKKTQFIVPLYLPQSPALYIAQLAILKAGGAFCPLPLDAPEHRLRFILQDVQAVCLLTNESCRHDLNAVDDTGVEIICVDEFLTQSMPAPTTVSIESSNPAYVMYTSGSTGKPKGVLISHMAATQALIAHDRHIPKFSRFLQFASPTFDVSVFEIFFPLIRHSTLVSCNRRDLLNDLPGVIDRLSVDAAELTPSVASNLLRDRASVPSLALLLTIGEMLKKSVVEQFGGDASQNAILYGMYGPTEATIHCTLHPCVQKNMSVNDIGFPLDTVSAFILRPLSQPSAALAEELIILPRGEEGELAVGGYQLADGYINRDEQTAAAFVQHPIYGRLYRTGDRAVITPEGHLQCLGRISSGQVKLRGQRIELGEVEYAASQASCCQAATAEVIGGILVLFCVLSEPSSSTDKVLENCRRWLPAFMVPNRIVALQSLPYLASGKVDRKALVSKLDGHESMLDSSSKEMTDDLLPIAQTLSTIFETPVDTSTKLATIGLDSLSAIRVAASLASQGFPRIDANRLLSAADIHDVALLLESPRLQMEELENNAKLSLSEQDRLRTHLQSIMPKTSDSVKDIASSTYPCTPVQRAMLAETARNHQAYCNRFVFAIDSSFQPDQVENALRVLISSTQLFRTGFIESFQDSMTYTAITFSKPLFKVPMTVTTFDLDFYISTPADLLRPCRIQLRLDCGTTQIMFQLHHALYDQWTVDLLKVQLTTILKGNEVIASPSFQDVALYYDRHTDVTTSDEEIEFWQDQLREFSMTPIPRLRGSLVPARTAKTPWCVQDMNIREMRAVCRNFECSLATLYQTAFAYMLSAWSGSLIVTFGVVTAGRSLPLSNIEQIFGPCLVTLPCLVDLGSVSRVSDLLQTINRSNRRLQQHCLTPLPVIKKNSPCDPQTALFDSLFIWQETGLDISAAAGIIKELDNIDYTEFNLVLEIEPRSDSVAMRATYQESLLRADQLILLFEQLSVLVGQIITHPHTLIEDFSKSFNGNLSSVTNPFPRSLVSSGIVAAVERQVETQAQAEAIMFADRIIPNIEMIIWTYSQLNETANRIAHALLADKCAHTTTSIYIWMEKSPYIYAAILGSWKAGLGYVPLAHDTPIARAKGIISQAAFAICLCDENTIDVARKLLGDGAKEIRTVVANQSRQTNPRITHPTSNVAYTIFTSGSTGEPKGVPVTFDNISSNIMALSKLYPIGPRDRLLQACSPAFDVSVFEIFFAMSNGICLCAARKEVLLEDLESSIRAFQITHLSMTPTVASLIRPGNIPSVRFMVTAGEGVTELVQNAWAGHGLCQGYGPSETTNICTVNLNMAADDVLGNIGTVLENTSGFVIDPNKDFTILPRGAIGEFAFGGEQVFDGYLNRPDLSSHALIQHPKYGRVYRSGDMGRMLADGTFISTGRRDDQVKLRGNRIEMGEINAAMIRSPLVADSATILLNGELSDPYLACFWLPSNNHEYRNGVKVQEGHIQTTQDLYASLEDTLPAYMIPSLLIPVSQMPLTTQGKLDKRMLKALIHELSKESRISFSRSLEDTPEDTAGLSDQEKELVASLAKVLQVPESAVSRHISFFALGLNSFSAIALSHEIRSRLKKRVKIEQILRNSTIARLGRTLGDCSVPAAVPKIAESDFKLDKLVNEAVNSKGLQDDIETVLPCTPLQEAMLLTAKTSTTTYCNSTYFIVHGDVERLRKSWNQIFERHTILRTIFVETDSRQFPVVQIVLRHKALPWFEDTSSLSTALKSSAVTMLDPCRLLLRHTDQNAHLTLQMHHAIYDGTSQGLLLHEVEQCYRGERLSPCADIAPFMVEVEAHRGGEALSYWESVMKTSRAKRFPRQANCAESTGLLRISLDKHANTMHKFCSRHSTTTLSVLQTAWTKVLCILQDAHDVCFGNVVSGRSVDVPGIERLIAPCFNTIPMRAQTDSIRSNIDLMKLLKTQNVASLEYQLTPLRLIQRLSKTPNHRPFDSLLILQPSAQKLDKELWTIDGEDGIMDLPLVVEFSASPHEMDLTLYYEKSMISDELAADIVRATEAGIASCLSYPADAVDNFSNFDPSYLTGQLRESDYGPSYTKLSASSNVEDEESWTETELMLRTAFSELSGVDVSRISRDTSLYALGLDSLNAVQIASKLRKQSFDVDAADVAKYLTPSAISQQLRRGQYIEKREYSSSSALLDYDVSLRPAILQAFDLKSDDLEAIRPCTPAQQGLLAQSVQTDGSLYINHISYRIPETTSRSEILDAWRCVQYKHQALRMGFYSVEKENSFAMLIYQPDSSRIRSDHIDTSTAREDNESLQSEIIENLHQPAWRLTFTKEGDHDIMKISIHHALFDAESLNILLTDFSASLARNDIGTPKSLDAIIEAQVGRSAHDLEKAKKYWHDSLHLTNINKFTNLCPAVIRNGTVRSVSLTGHQGKGAIETWCRSHEVTMQAIGQATWARLLSAYLGDDQVTFGTIFSTRQGGDTSDVAFPCIATIPVICDVKQAGVNIVKEMLKQNVAGQEHRHLPLTDIQRAADHPGQSIFDTVFVYQNSSESPLSWHVHEESVSVDYALSLEMKFSKDGATHLRLTFRDDHIPHDQASLILRQFDRLLSDFITPHGDSAIDDHELFAITPAKTPVLPAPVSYLHEFVAITARRIPDHIALEFIDAFESFCPRSRKWTYAQLDDRSNQVAHLIRQNAVKSGSIVAVCMERSPEASFAFLGILKAGCSFLAMDPNLPHARRNFILEDSGASLLLVSSGKSDDFGEINVSISEVDEEALAHLPTREVKYDMQSPDETCYNLYTSGTTGQPKGCEISHTNAVQAMMAFQKLFDGRWDKNSRWLQFASYWFDVSILEHFWSWAVGITVVGAPRDLILEDIPAFLRNNKISHVDLTPSLAVLVQPDDVPTLHNHVFITGGEAIKQDIINAWGPKYTVCNGYGPTETTIGVTMLRFLGPDTKPSNIGPQFDNVGTLVLDPLGDAPVLRGCIGELCITGPLVGKGYLNRPEMTAKAFPYLDRFGERAYRTGDLVRILHDGSFSFVGRKDTQVKLRGQRLEISEIEKAIDDASEKIAGAVCMVMKSDSNDRESLIAFVATNQKRQTEIQVDMSGQASQLVQMATACCQDRLPQYMIPTHIIPITFVPLTSNNKVDNKRLTALYEALSIQDLQKLKRSGFGDVQLSSEESKVARTLGDLLKIDYTQMAPSSNVFSIGLSSISAIQFSKSLRKAGYSRASPSLIMTRPIIRQLVQALTDSRNEHVSENFRYAAKQAQLRIAAFAKRWQADVAVKLGISPSAIETVIPCTPLQEGMLLDSIHRPQRPYFNQFRYDTSSIDPEKLQTAIDKTIAVAGIYRTKFVQCEDGFAQVAVKDSGIKVQVWEGEQDCESRLGLQYEKWLSDNATQINRALEVILIQGDGHAELIFNAHHAIYDGISWELSMNQLQRCYLGEQLNNNLHIPTFTEALPYGPLQSVDSAQSYWQNELSACCSGNLKRRSDCYKESTVSTSFELVDLQAFHNARRQLGVSHQALVQMCFETALVQQSPDTDMYGHVVSGRAVELENADQTIGPLFNTVPARIKITPDQSWADAINELHKSNVDMLPYQHTPLRSIRKWTGRHATDSPFAAIFVFQMTSEDADPHRRTVWTLRPQQPTAHYPLAFEATLSSNDKLSIELVSQEQYLDAELLDRFAADFERAFALVMSDYNTPVCQEFTIPQRNHGPGQGSAVISSVDTPPAGVFDWTAQADHIRRTLADMIQAGGEIIDEQSTFFGLGLDSIDAVKLSSLLKKEEISITMGQIIQAQTIPAMMQIISQKNEESNGTTQSNLLKDLEEKLRATLNIPDAEMEDIERILPATPSQEAMIADMLRSDFNEYYNHDILRLSDDVDVDDLIDAWQLVADVHPILRTGFVDIAEPDIDFVFAQVVRRTGKLRVPKVHLDTEPDFEGIEEEIRQHIMQSSSYGCSPFQITIVETPEARYVVLSLAHAQYDGHSLALIHEDVQKALNGQHIDRPTYDEAIEQILQSSTTEARSFWADTLATSRAVPFPLKSETKTAALVNRNEIVARLATEEARSFCRDHTCSMQTLAQTCWALVLAHYTQSLEIRFGAVLACRDSESLEEIVYPVMNTVVINAVLHGSLGDMVAYMQSVYNKILPFQRLPLRDIQAAARMTDAAGVNGTGLFDTLFIYQQRPSGGQAMRDPPYQSVQASSRVEYPVAAELEAVGNQIILRAACKSTALNSAEMLDLLECFNTILDAIVASPSEPTLTFTDKSVSICKMPSFEPRDDITLNMHTPEEREDDDAIPDTLLPAIESIRHVLSQVSKVPESSIGMSTSIEFIGIDSISAIKVASLLRQRELKISVSSLIRANTLAKIAAAIHNGSELVEKSHALGDESSLKHILSMPAVHGAPDAAGFAMDNIESVLPATSGQVYMINAWAASQGQLFYSTFAHKIKGAIERAEIEAAWQCLVTRHAALRTVFCSTTDETVPLLQVVLKRVSASQGFKVAQNPQRPMSSLHISPDAEGWLIQVSLHHGLYDAISLGIIMDDFRKLLQRDAIRTQHQSIFAQFLTLSMNPAAWEEQKSFWTGYLARTEPLSLATCVKESISTRVEVWRPELWARMTKVERLARKNNISTHSVLFAVYAKLYAEISSKSNSNKSGQDVVLGVYLSNRAHLPDLSELASPTLNIVPLVLRAVRTTSVVDLARKVQLDLKEIGTPVRSAVGLWKIAEWTGIRIDCFVNLVMLPDDTLQPGVNTSDVDMVEFDEAKKRPYTKIVSADSAADFRLPEELREIPGSDAYLPSLDFEASITDGALNVGIFCPEAIVGVGDVDGVLENLTNLLDECVEH